MDQGQYRKDLHLQFIDNLEKQTNEFEYYASESLKLSAVYWALTTLYIIDEPEFISHDSMEQFICECQNLDGGFGASVDFDSHILYTLSAVQVLLIIERFDPEKYRRNDIIKFIKKLQQPDGSFWGDEWGEYDTRFSYCAISCLALLDALDEIDQDAAVDYILQCQNFDGGFGKCPGAESHAAQIFCCVGALKILGKLEKLDTNNLVYYLKARQLPSGGLNGRPEKLEDVCYSWWVLSSLEMLGRVDQINGEALCRFILDSQDLETGGIADRKGRQPDIFHTVFGTVGLSLLKFPGLKQINPTFCLPQSTISKYSYLLKY